MWKRAIPPDVDSGKNRIVADADSALLTHLLFKYNSRGFISKKQTSPEKLSQNTELSFIANLDEICNVIMEEHKTYPLSAFLSDTGGAAGLFLGLNIIGFINWLMIKFMEIFRSSSHNEFIGKKSN